jgi:uncharacterized RDD family membrane protein YckC
MRCHSCGALHEIDFERCTECGASTVSEQPETVDEASPTPQKQARQTSRLIEFPGVVRSTVPQWRKELSERVREVQERRALEAAEEEHRLQETTADPKLQLELLPQAAVVPINPLVAAALRRIERAHVQSSLRGGRSNNAAAATAVAYANESEYLTHVEQDLDVAEVVATDPQLEEAVLEAKPAQPDKAHYLVVVPPPHKNEGLEINTLPRRMIAGDPNDPALNYLDAVTTAVRAEDVGHVRAPALSRFIGALIDLLVVGLLWTPFAAAVELANLNWQDLRVVIAGAGVFPIVGFIYLTVSTALTGRTLGMRLLSLRVVDDRTGLIPTGSQSAGRGLLYLASLLTLGIGIFYALVDSEQRTAHDRLTHTAVILT